MTSFCQFLHNRLESGGFTTEDTLASALPLMREVLEAHAAGAVAPLQGVEELHVEGVRIWFEEAKRRPIRTNAAALGRVGAASQAVVEVVAEVRQNLDLDDGTGDWLDLSIGDHETEITRPVYLPGYVAWEHALEHHDPLTDIFSLGMILASLACGLDFQDPDDLRRFVAHRRNLFALNPTLHPVLAQAIVRMTELDRRRRAQDLSALALRLENYREQDVDLEFDLAQALGAAGQDVRAKQQVVLRKLRERLFEISRRNRLLHFRPTMQTVNLTHASVPLSFDIKNIRPDQILVWNDRLHDQVTAGKPISLNHHLNFSEALYLPSVLDRILAEARRDQAEYGFAQLRLVLCFLHWANLKEQPIERFESPLVLLPATLKKKKGIRDTYLLEPLSAEAEINPVVRHQFQELYGIDLPETLDLANTRLDAFFEVLSARIRASEPGVSLTKIDRPRIALIHEKARRRLDHYRRRARLAGRGVRTFLDLDYSYDPANYHPLGITLFTAKVRLPATHLRALIEEKPRPRAFAAPAEEAVVEKERSFYSLQSGGEENPYHWTFDLCNVTLANFKYRKMSLVRDYQALLAESPSNAAFEAVFSLAPRAAERALPPPRPLEDRYDVVPCDPTQASAIDEAHASRSYIIQGPPGTGKSQTIANLIADYAARGKRVLFVCEKRAAIDVVYARLRQRGLASLCCLIHDSQTDKRDFVADLKQTYETILAQAEQMPTRRDERNRVLRQLLEELQPLERFDAAMQETPPELGVPVRRLLGRRLEVRDLVPELPPQERERLPPYAEWRRHQEAADAFAAAVQEIQPDGVLSRHPLSLLSRRLAREERPWDLVTRVIESAETLLAQIEEKFAQSGAPRELWRTLARAQALSDYARRILPFARVGQMALLDRKSKDAARLRRRAQELRKRREALADAQAINRHWKQKLPPAEVAAALEQAQSFEGRTFAWLRPAWWRMRSVLRRSYDFPAHAVRPTWRQVLASLEQEYAAADRLAEQRQVLVRAYRLDGEADAAIETIFALQKELARPPAWLSSFHAQMLASPQAWRFAEAAASAEGPLASLADVLARIADDFQEEPLDDLRRRLQEALGALDDLPDYLVCMQCLAGMSDSLARALHRLPYPVQAVEAAIADSTLSETIRTRREVRHFNGAAHRRHVSRLEELYARWLESNAEEIRHRIQQRFLENVRAASLPAAHLTPEQKEFKKRYVQGRRELEHEFGKVMRFKAIRDLVSHAPGEVVKDLKPVWLMSPVSVSDTLPMDAEHFDVVIFDEASQVTLEEAVPSIFRARQTIVVGDEMQLPPTNFFSARRTTEEDEDLLVEEDGELVQYDLDSDSLLNHAAKNLPSTMLGWHYRSRSESLISFSNWAFYDGRLLTVPEEKRAMRNRPPLCLTSAAEAETAAAELLQRAISFHFLEHGVYDKRRNRAEAEYIAHLIRALLNSECGLSVGVVAFSEAQQGEIEAALERLAQEDRDFARRLEAEWDREEDGQFLGLLVKNLENIQGDERDVILLSVCYGYGPNGKMLMNFGPINKSGGEKRLNVAFSRAKRHMAVVSSIREADITNEYNTGANCLKSYLRYAEAVSTGDRESAARVLRGMSRWQEGAEQRDGELQDVVVEQLAAALESRGLQVDRLIGQSHFRCDLAVYREGDSEYRLGILVDTPAHYEQPDILAREMMRPRLLRDFGWRVATVLAKDWYEDPEKTLDGLLSQIDAP